jgi:hypothetical protein
MGRGATALIYGLRSEATGRRGVPLAGAWLGCVALAGGLYLALRDAWPLAVVCFASAAALLWLGGWWALPFGRDAYVERLRASMTDWATEVEAATDRMAHRQAQLLERLERLTPPPQFQDDDVALLRMLSAQTAVGDASSTALAPAEIEVINALRWMDAVKDRLAGVGPSETRHPYASSAISLVDESLSEFSTGTRAAQRAASRAQRRLSRGHVPARLVTEHAALLRALHDVIESENALYAAREARDRDRAVRAAERLEKAIDDLQMDSAKAIERAGFDTR